MTNLPRIEKLPKGRHQFLVDGKPYLIRGGELQNSSFSSAGYMKDAYPKLGQLGLNTVLGSIAWEQIEPEEGKFDFEEVDKVIQGAREHGLRVIVLWFGAYKNGASPRDGDMELADEKGNSTYAPGWVKLDNKRFPRSLIRKDGVTKMQDCNSLFGEHLLQADCKAFKALMGHLKVFDGKNQTVIMVQVENEVGLIGDSRDRLPAAEKVFNAPPDASIMATLGNGWESLGDQFLPALEHFDSRGRKVGSSWAETFGESLRTDELFMAVHYARYIDTLAQAGREVYNLPMYANAWLPGPAGEASGGDRPGGYPSGGPVIRVIDVWRLFAPNLDFVCPDIYIPQYDETCAEYRKCGQPLFIPEQQGDDFGALRFWTAIGTADALGVSPFGIDNADPATSSVTGYYSLLEQVAPFILAARAEGREMYGLHFDGFEKGAEDPSSQRQVKLGDWNLTITRSHVFGHPSPGYGIIIAEPDDKFLLIGEGFQVKFDPVTPASFSSILSFDEMEVVDGKLVKGRLLNGDETATGGRMLARMPGPNPDDGPVPVPVRIPSKTKIAYVRPYYIA